MNRLENILKYLKIVSILYILVFLLPGILLFSETETTDDKVKDKIYFDPRLAFSFSERFALEFSDSNILFINFENKVFTQLDIPVRIYNASFWIEDRFTLDFTERTNPDIKKMLNNSLTFGFENRISKKNIINANINFEFNFTIPYNEYKLDILNHNIDKPYILLDPILIIGGSYYFGLDFSVLQILETKLVLEADNSAFIPITAVSLSYEFFRFYGPKDLKFTISLENSTTYFIPFNSAEQFSLTRLVFIGEDEEEDYDEENWESEDNVTNSGYARTVENSLDAGIFFDFYNVRPSLYFTYKINYNVTNEELITNGIGIRTGISYTFNQFTFSLNYSGSTKTNNPTLNWDSALETSVSIWIFR